MRLPAAAGRGGVYHGDDYEPSKRNTLQCARVELVLGRRRRCWYNHRHVLVQHCTSIARTLGFARQVSVQYTHAIVYYFVSVQKGAGAF